MKIKIEYLLLIGIIAALAVYLVMRNTDRTLYELPAIPEVAAGEFTKIEISGKQRSITLLKADEKWSIQPQGYPVDPSRIKGMLATVSSLKTTALASESKDYQRYDLDAEHKISVKAWAGDSLKRNFDLGKAAPSFRHTFIKLVDDPRVFHSRDNFRSKFDLDAVALQDKTIMRLETSAVKRLKITADGVEAEFSRQAEAVGDGDTAENPPPAQWQMSDGRSADRAAVEKLLNSAVRLRCQRFIDGLEKDDLADSIYTLELIDGGAHTLTVFSKRPEDSELYPAVSSESRFPFYLAAAQAEQLMQKPQALLPKKEVAGKSEKKGK